MRPRSYAARLLLAPLLVAGLLVACATHSQESPKPARGSAKPAGTSKSGAPAAADGAKGRLVYQAACAACHTSGLAGAPKLGDAEAWAPRASAGTAPVYTNALKGKGAMPPKGGNASLSDADVRSAVDFMLAQARVVPGPPAPAAAAAAAAAAPATASAVAAAPPAPRTYESSDPNAFNRLLTAPGRRNPPPAEDGIHDPESPGTGQLQAPLVSFQLLPRSNLGNYVNWAAALGKKRIQPRWDASNPKSEAIVMDLTIVREVKGSMPDVVFPHKQHTEWLDCASCHPAIFIPQKGANQISMAAIMLGQKCGVCHGKVAFPISECRLCHARQKGAEARAAEASPAGGDGR